jgi:hypothetical protein
MENEEHWYKDTSTLLIHKFSDAHDDICYEVLDSNNNIIGVFSNLDDMIIFITGKIDKMGAYL